MSTEPILSSFQRLSSDEKLRLVQELWDQIASEVAGMPLTDSQRRLLDERIDQHEKNPEDVEPWDKVKKDVLGDL
jgi:putative addiction module component (TIGR02574 family)